MKKPLIVLGILVIALIFSNALSAQIIVKSGKKGLFLEHVVVAKEGLYSIGRLYNVHPRHIASYNGIDYNKGLNIGQVLHIPLSDTNFTQKAKSRNPVYYSAGENESLQKVSDANKKVPVQKLKEWNKLRNDKVAPDSKLIVGFLVTENSSLTASATVKEDPKKDEAKKTDPKTDKTTTKTEPTATKAPPKDDPRKDEAKKTDTKTDKTAVKTEVATTKAPPQGDPKKDETKKTDPKTEKATTKTETVATKPSGKDEVKKDDVKKEETKTDPALTRLDMSTTAVNQGYFKSSFDQQVKAIPVTKMETVTAGVFKVITRMEEAKYYVLVDGVPAGTVVKVVNPDNNKAIYAKVLGEMNSIRPNQGLDMRISNTAASSLGIDDMDKFIVKINY